MKRFCHLERNQRCSAGKDGECFSEDCPQLLDGEPERSGRYCPLVGRDDVDELGNVDHEALVRLESHEARNG